MSGPLDKIGPAKDAVGKDNEMDVGRQIEAARVIAIIRGNYVGVIPALVEALLAGGVSVVEVTMNSEGVLEAIQTIAQRYADRALVGAGTVTQVDQVAQVAKAGARFVVSPDMNPEVVRAALDHGLEPVPGALTPTEILQAMRSGAKLVKLFPATLGGPEYLKQIRAPLDMVRLVPTGGIDASNARAYFEAGAVAVGVGSALVRNNFDGSPDAIGDLTLRARRLMDALSPIRTYEV
jgi:2-dehydro-3-deoxyphosphogluconate aldolase / (4S)-4-hydroxy-2-oxoglutarate aldolase